MIKDPQAQFSALADPTRRALLLRLAEGEATVLELTAPFGISQPAISRHLKVLEQAGLISRRVEGAKRPCRLEPDALAAAEAWLAALRPAPKAGKSQKKNKKKNRKKAKNR